MPRRTCKCEPKAWLWKQADHQIVFIGSTVLVPTPSSKIILGDAEAAERLRYAIVRHRFPPGSTVGFAALCADGSRNDK
jgi:hypothetical protein